jgi:hypothetical protein
VRANPVTGSVLVGHDAGKFDEIADYARELDLFELNHRAEAAAQSPGAIIRRGLASLDSWIRSQTDQRTSLNSVAATALLAGAAWQATRGHVLPTAAQLMLPEAMFEGLDGISLTSQTVDVHSNATPYDGMNDDEMAMMRKAVWGNDLRRAPPSRGRPWHLSPFSGGRMLQGRDREVAATARTPLT